MNGGQYEELLRKDGMALRGIPPEERSEELCKIAINQNVMALKFVPKEKKTKELCLTALRKNLIAIHDFPIFSNETREIYLEAVKYDYRVLGLIGEIHDKEMYAEALKQDWKAIEYFPKKITEHELYELITKETEEQIYDVLKGSICSNFKLLPEVMGLKLLQRYLADTTYITEKDVLQLFKIAIVDNMTNVIALLLKDSQINPAANNNEIIRMAVDSGTPEIIELLLRDPRIDPAANDNELIRRAVEKKKPEIVKLLLRDPRIDPASNQNNILRVALKDNYLEMAAFLLKNNYIDPNDFDSDFRISDEGYGLLLDHPRIDVVNNKTIDKAIATGRVREKLLRIPTVALIIYAKEGELNKVESILEQDSQSEIVPLVAYIKILDSSPSPEIRKKLIEHLAKHKGLNIENNGAIHILFLASLCAKKLGFLVRDDFTSEFLILCNT